MKNKMSPCRSLLTFVWLLTLCLHAQAAKDVKGPLGENDQRTLRELFSANALMSDVAKTRALIGTSANDSSPFEASARRARGLEDEGREAVVPPKGLATENYTLISILNTNEDKNKTYYERMLADDHLQTIRMGRQGSDVYIQGLSLRFPEAWVKGTLSDDQTALNIPSTQYLGSSLREDGETVDWLFMGYDSNGGYGEYFTVGYNAADGTIQFSVRAQIAEQSEWGDEYVLHLYPQIAKQLPEDKPVTPPSGLVTKDYLMEGIGLYGEEAHLALKIGFQQNDVYIRGLFPVLPDAWVKGKLSGDEIIIPKWQFLGESDVIDQIYSQLDDIPPMGNKRFYLYGLDLNTYTFGDLVLQYDKVNDTMTCGIFAIGASRINLEAAISAMQNATIAPISETAAVPSAPEFLTFATKGNDYQFTFDIPITDVDGHPLVTDKLYYKILTSQQGQTSTVTFKPSDYEGLTETMSLIPYGFTLGQDFSVTFNSNSTSTSFKSVVIKGNMFTSLNKMGVVSVYKGGGATHESEAVWYTVADAYDLLRSERSSTYYYLTNDQMPLGKAQLQAAYDDATATLSELDEMDEESIMSYNLMLVLQAVGKLKAAREAFIQLNADTGNVLISLNDEISEAYNLYNSEDMYIGKDDLMEAIRHAEELRDEVAGLDEEALKQFDMSVVDDEIERLREAEQAYRDIIKQIVTPITKLQTEIEQAYELYYDDLIFFGKDDLMDAIFHAEELLNELWSLDEETLKNLDPSVINSEIYALKWAQQVCRDLNTGTHDSISQLESEIEQAYDVYNDYYYNFGRDAFYEFISHAQDLLNDFYSLSEEEQQAYDMSVISEEIATLQQVKQEFVEFNTTVNSQMEQLSSAIDYAYSQYYDDDLEFDRDILHSAIEQAEKLYNDVYDMDDDAIFNYDLSLVSDEISSLQAAVKAFVTVNTVVDEAEWKVLKAYHQSVNASEWARQWDFSSSTRSRKALPGVKSYDGHVLSIDLSGNNIVGPFPYDFLTLPQMETLILSYNQLTGDIGAGMTQFLKGSASTSSSIRYLDIAENELSGNISTIANALPELQYLDASGNHLEEVTPAIPSTVKNVYLDDQSIERVADLHLSQLAEGTLLKAIPNIMLYNHSRQSYMKELYLEFDDTEGKKVEINLEDKTFHIYNYGYKYKGENGALINTRNSYATYSNTTRNCSLPIRLYFEEGDINFSGQTDILDLQAQIDYIVEDYYDAVNFTAGNLWKDEKINVQDAVCLVNLLLDKNPGAANARRLIGQNDGEAADANQVFIDEGRLFINTTSPIAAFDIVVSTESGVALSSELSAHGLTCSMREADGHTHLIGYSLSGGTLPEGLTEIGCNVEGAVVYAMCAGKDAREIPVSLNLTPTDIPETSSNMNTDDIRYVIPMGTKYAICIDANGKKTLRRITK